MNPSEDRLFWVVAYLILPTAITLLTGVTFYAVARVVRHLVAS